MKKLQLDKVTVLSSAMCLAPILLGLFLYPRLPDQIAVHWDASGRADHFAPKAFAVFLLPLFLLIVNFAVNAVLVQGAPAANISASARGVLRWCVGAIAIVVQPVTLLIAIGVKLSIRIVAPVIVGVLLVIVGCCLPRCKQNHFIGIRLPWTLCNVGNWDRTHRVAGYLWITGGVLTVLGAFFDLWWGSIAMPILLSGVTAGYSFYLHQSGRENLR